MPDLFSALDLGLEMSRFLQSAEGNVTKVILQPTQRDAEIVLELSQKVLDEHASRAFVVMVLSEGGSLCFSAAPTSRANRGANGPRGRPVHRPSR